MAQVTELIVERCQETARLQPTKLSASVKVYGSEQGPIIQIDTYGSSGRKYPSSKSQTLQFGRDVALELLDLIENVYGPR